MVAHMVIVIAANGIEDHAAEAFAPVRVGRANQLALFCQTRITPAAGFQPGRRIGGLQQTGCTDTHEAARTVTVETQHTHGAKSILNGVQDSCRKREATCCAPLVRHVFQARNIGNVRRNPGAP
jgi:hypothetical protein